MSGLRNLRRGEEREDEAAGDASREDVFQRRSKSQQHLKFHGPVLRALIRLAGDLDLKRNPGVFERRVLEARGLAVKVAAGVLGKPESQVTMDEARPYRQECSEAVAWAWTKGGAVDHEGFAREMVRAASVADAAFDADTVPWKLMSAPGSMAMTVVPVVMRLRHVVEAYDFREGPDAVLARMVRLASEVAAAAVDDILPSHATLADRRSLFQSILREYTHDLRVIYEQAARRSVTAMAGLPEGDRLRYLEDTRPLDAVCVAFRGVASRNTALNAASVKAALGELLPPRDGSRQATP